MHKFSEFAEESNLYGQKMKIGDILGQEIAVKNYRITGSRYSDKREGKRCLTLQFTLNAEPHVLFTGSEVLIEQIERYKDKLPFLATIQRIDKFYSFT